MSETLTAPAPAKLNLFLRVLAREADGFHGIETLFCRTDLADELAIRRTADPGVRLNVTGTGADTGPAEDNLVTRAAEMVLAATGADFGLEAELTKRVPVRAGLGGGSSDAATALALVNRLAGDAVPRHELLQFAARLGSDVPFFLSEARLALAWGHGERLLRLPPLPARAGLLLVPDCAIDTPTAYGWIDEVRMSGEEGTASGGRRGAVAMTPDTLANWSDIARLAGNDFESPVFAHHPEVRAGFEALVGTGPFMCRLSGSGSALFGLYRTEREREDAAMMLGSRWGRLIPFATAA